MKSAKKKIQMEDKIAVKKFINAQESLVTQQSDFSLMTITQMVENNAIDLAPHYQRRDRWTSIKQSALIESFILNVPVPPVYLSEEEYGIYSVIDGKQRITAISSFLKGVFKLKGLKKFPELNGLSFKMLPQSIQNALSIRPYVRVVTLLRQTNPELKYEVFLRLNTGGEKLRPQEIRNVAYSGSLNNLLYELSENKILKTKLKIFDSKSTSFRKMEDLEHILRFFSLNNDLKNIGSVLSVEMDKFMQKNRSADVDYISILRNSFNTSILRCDQIWPEIAFFKPISTGWREQLISPLYDAQMVASFMLTEIEFEKILKKTIEIRQQLIKELYNNNEVFSKAVSQATNNKANIISRISIMYDSLISLI